MIIKIKTRNNPSFKHLLEYISDKEKSRLPDTKKQSFIITHNLKGNSIKQWTEQFKKNEAYRKHKRTDSVYIYHEVLSWHEGDAKNITPEKMEMMTREYIQLRNPNGIYVAVQHYDTGHPHVHICASGIEYRTGKSLRLSKTNLLKLKKETQNYQIQHFPELSNSVVEHGKGGKSMLDKEYQLKLRTGKQTANEMVKQLVETCLHKATSKDNFFKLLNENGLSTYIRGGSVYGVKFGKHKHRFKTMSFSPEQLNELDRVNDRSRSLEDIRKKQKIKQHGIKR